MCGAEDRTSAPFEQSARTIITYYHNNCDNKWYSYPNYRLLSFIAILEGLAKMCGGTSFKKIQGGVGETWQGEYKKVTGFGSELSFA